jgi:hypothetical protein
VHGVNCGEFGVQLGTLTRVSGAHPRSMNRR